MIVETGKSRMGRLIFVSTDRVILRSLAVRAVGEVLTHRGSPVVNRLPSTQGQWG